MTTLFLDTETWGDLPLKKVGAYRYAESCETIIVSMAIDDDPVQVWDMSDPEPRKSQLAALQSMIDRVDEVVIHNSTFDRVTLAAQGVVIPVEKITDSMVIALTHGLPGALDTLCDVLSVPRDKAKDKDGKKLIQLFCKPRPKNTKLRRATKETHPNEWGAFLEYARLDIVAMREVLRRLPRWNHSDAERQLWRLDQDTNDLGFRIDLDLARSALRAFGGATSALAVAANDLTGGAVGSTTQRNRLLEYMNTELGFQTADLTKGTVERLLRDPSKLPDGVRILLENRQQAAATSPAKYQALIEATGSDGRLRGTLQFSGAARTLRDAGRIYQPQNLPRCPDWFDATVQELTIQAFKDEVEGLLYDDIVDRCTYAIRGSMIAEDGKKFCIADLSNIEGRVLAWLAGEDWKLEAFKKFDRGEGPDLYKVTAGRILGKEPGDVTKDERQMEGKVPELACGFGGALGAFRRMGGAKVDAMDDDRIIAIVKQWRGAHPATVKYWYALERAAKLALENPGNQYIVRSVAFDVKVDDFGQTWLRMKKPSGGYLLYLNARIEKHTCPKCDGTGKVAFVYEGVEKMLGCPECGGVGTVGSGQITYEGMDQYTRQWKRLETYYGRLVENLVQSVARDVFMTGYKRAMHSGYPVVLRVHDELVAEVPDTPEYTHEALSEMMAKPTQWMLGLPLAAAGFECHRYRKG